MGGEEREGNGREVEGGRGRRTEAGGRLKKISSWREREGK